MACTGLRRLITAWTLFFKLRRAGFRECHTSSVFQELSFRAAVCFKFICGRLSNPTQTDVSIIALGAVFFQKPICFYAVSTSPFSF